MTMIRSGKIRSQNAVWLIPGRSGRRPSVRRRGAGVLARTVGVAALLAGAALGLAPGEAPAVASREPQAPPAAVVAEAGKDQARLATFSEPRREPVRASAPGQASGAFSSASLAGKARLMAPGGDLVTGSLGAFQRSPAGPEAGAKEQEFAQIEVIDGRTIAAGPLRIRLVGLDLPAKDEVCRTLDGRLEACAARAATQLELLTRSRTVVCRYRLETSSEGAGTCRIGASDLAERMLRTGYTKRLAAAQASAPLPGEPVAN
jgi:hypothetical protein